MQLKLLTAVAGAAAAAVVSAQQFQNERFTWFEPGLGACGQNNGPNDFQYDGGAHCFQTITITALGKTTTAQIVDECPGCPFGGLDLSPGLFEFFAPLSEGVITGGWSFD
ncbi:hypothetical protein PUNSTDRAFT_46839 [Punctularia strigosozonata HHB-11173 SS5]|uniref:uncharacterized protein n=1 Tax=Punctularia strigosozonata (strain HHB-11173) TaxID=741275 RepID=UPI0004416721|nr:uncharacterized protein PUNSTDRAFT_46839 [Punctularia strigosozonata HHB-11173 SS5]EIN05474.1 hypothetical protein PUNSTDRAFT_46839 [Punctularia strigosozonata HHB-11173 SS5]